MPLSLTASLRALGLVAAEETPRVEALAGGVSSDIVRVVTDRRTFCVKRALPRLKVAAVWEAPVERNAAEAEFLRTVAGWLPDSVPALLGEDPAAGLFCMEYLPPEEFPVWKTELLAGRIDPVVAREVGSRLGMIHRRSARDPELARRFDHAATFEAIRIEPYLGATALAHPGLAAALDALAARTRDLRVALVHGDISPKNILCGPAGPVFLDAECATYGDPAFDLAFCATHLLLKSAHRPEWSRPYLAAFGGLIEAHLGQVDWEPPADVERRAATLLPALVLARLDGKSPVDYLGPPQADAVRRLAIHLLEGGGGSCGDIGATWSRRFG